MDWTASIDLYCERLSPGPFAEPLNAVSNVAFLLVAWIGFAAARKDCSDRAGFALAALVATIGVGSLLFHVFANRWSVLADVGPITLFIFVYLWLALRRFLGADRIAATIIVVLFALLSWPVEAAFRPFIAGSAGYVPALLAMFVVGAALAAKGDAAARPIVLAAAVFLASLTFRTLDDPLCAAWPHGTHFLWHIFNAATLAILLDAMVRHGQALHFSGEARQHGTFPPLNGSS
jgi:hypothetical protein